MGGEGRRSVCRDDLRARILNFPALLPGESGGAEPPRRPRRWGWPRRKGGAHAARRPKKLNFLKIVKTSQNDGKWVGRAVEVKQQRATKTAKGQRHFPLENHTNTHQGRGAQLETHTPRRGELLSPEGGLLDIYIYNYIYSVHISHVSIQKICEYGIDKNVVK